MNLTKNHLFQIAITPTNGAAGTTDINGTTADCQAARGIGMFVLMGAITVTAVTTIKAQGSDDGSTWNDLEGTAQTIADTDDDKLFYIDITYPMNRYNRVYVDRGTANAVVAAAWYELYNLREKNPTHGTGVSGELYASPPEGTA